MVSNAKFLSEQSTGFTVNFCCGRDAHGDVRVDVDRAMLYSQKKSVLDGADYVVADVHNPPFIDGCCDSLIIDPPFSLFNRFKWLLNLSRLARSTVIVSHNQINLKLPGFTRECFCINSKSIYLRLWWVFTCKEASR